MMDGLDDGWMGGRPYVLIKTQPDLCQRPSRHRPQPVLPQPLLTYAGPMPNFKKNHQKFHFFLFWDYLNPRKPIRIEEIHSGVYPPSTPMDLSTDHVYYLVETLESILGPRSFKWICCFYL
jgi:hypothetical protein